MQAVRIRSDDSIQLPKTLLRRFPKRSELAVWAEGDVIVLKRLKPAKLSAIATRRPREGGAACGDRRESAGVPEVSTPSEALELAASEPPALARQRRSVLMRVAGGSPAWPFANL